MSAPRRRFALIPAFALIFIGTFQTVRAESGVVWLTAHSEAKDEETVVRIPLEWIASADREGKSEIRFDEVTIDCDELWLAYKDLPVGESHDVKRGTTDDGEDYVTRVVSEKPSTKKAEGKVHILSRDRDGKSTDVRFPLDLTGLMQKLGDLIGSFFGTGSGVHSTGTAAELDIKQIGDLRSLADYGPFVFLQSREADGSRVKISIE
jgi:hypothetical protein